MQITREYLYSFDRKPLPPPRCVCPLCSPAPCTPPPPTRSRVAHCTTRYGAGSPTTIRAGPRPQTRHPRVTPTATLDSRVRVSHSPPAGPAPLTAQRHNSEPRRPVSPPRFRPREPFAPTAALEPRVRVSHSPPAGPAPLTAQRHNSEPRRPVSTPRFRPREPSLQLPLESRVRITAACHLPQRVDPSRSCEAAPTGVRSRSLCFAHEMCGCARGLGGASFRVLAESRLCFSLTQTFPCRLLFWLARDGRTSCEPRATMHLDGARNGWAARVSTLSGIETTLDVSTCRS